LWIGSQDTIVRGFDFTSTGLPVAPDVHLVENASHASFTPPCSGFWALLGRNGCQEVGGFDRAAFHHAFNQSVIAFFRKHLPQ
jgi:predicted dienelactone hydrolase